MHFYVRLLNDSVGLAPAAAPVTLRISFPEGFTVRRMVDRVAEVRMIAIRKRHVRPC